MVFIMLKFYNIVYLLKASMKYISYLFLLFFSLNSYGQDTLIIDASFEETALYSTIEYHHDIENNQDISSIQSKEFLLFNTSFPGLKNAKFWFHFNLENTFSEQREIVLKIKTHTISHLTIYKVTGNSVKTVYQFSNSFKKKIDIPIELQAALTTKFYIEVAFTRSVFFPSKIVTIEKNESLNNSSLINDALFYGFSLVVLIINLLFFITTKNRFFLYYCILLMAITLSFMNVQGLFYCFFDSYGAEFKIFMVLLLNLAVMIAYILFTTSALGLNKHYPRHKLLGGTLLVFFLIFSLLYLITYNMYWYSFVKIIYFSTTIIYWFYGVLLFKKLVYARFLTLAYTILLGIQIAFMLSINFGYTEIGFTEQYYKIGFVIEMLVFLYAISYRHKKIETERQHIENQLKEKLKTTHNIISQNKLIEDKINSTKTPTLTEEEVYKLFAAKFNLTTRELELCKFIVKGDSNEEITLKASIKITTVKYHVSNIFKKLQVKNRTEILALYILFKGNK